MKVTAVTPALVRNLRLRVRWLALTLLAASAIPAFAQSCENSSDMDDATRSGITAVAQRYFDMAAKGDTASLRQNSMPNLAADFSGIESTIKAQEQDLSGAQAKVKPYLLEVEGKQPLPHGEFLCGVFGRNGHTANSTAFYFDNLSPGKYAVALIDATKQQARTSFTEILQQSGADWKLAGLYINSAQLAGHDSDWFLTRAREFKSKGQLHNAWLYEIQSRQLAAPLNFMSTLATDQFDAEVRSLQPSDVPANGKTTDLNAGSTTYKLIALFPAAVGNDLDLIVRYQSASISDTNRTYADNVAVMKATLAKYPEFKDAFAGMVARATDPSGRDYGTLLAMKDIK